MIQNYLGILKMRQKHPEIFNDPYDIIKGYNEKYGGVTLFETSNSGDEMIPPVEPRQARECWECVCCHDGWDCSLCIERQASQPCRYHMTDIEYRELIESGVI